MQLRKLLLGSTAAAALAASGGAALAQDSAETQDQTTKTDQTEVIALPEWSDEALYTDGWSAETLIDEAEVMGSEGEEIGDIENILVSEEGKILAVIVEMGGFLDLGDTHIMVPWDQVEVAPDLESLTVPVDQENAEEFSMYGSTSLIRKADTDDKRVIFEDIDTGPRIWQATELIDDYVTLDGGIGYGYVDDLIFNDAGELDAVIVSTDFGYGQPGLYAYPFYGYGHGFAPGAPNYALPYTADQVADAPPYDTASATQ